MKSPFLIALLLSSPLFAAETPPEPAARSAREANRDLAMEECHKLDTSQHSDCELRVRQGLDEPLAEQDIDPLPTDRVAPPDEPKDDDEH